MSRCRKDEGFVLLSVLTVIGVVSALALVMTVTVRADRSQAATERRLVQAGALADAGLTRIMAAMKSNDRSFLDKLAYQSRPMHWHFAEREISLLLEPETGKIDLNAGESELVVSVMRAVVRDSSKSERLLQRLDRMRRSQQELETVRGLLDPEDRVGPLARDLDAVFTVWTGLRGIDPRFAPAVTLRHLPGLQPGEAEQFVKARLQGNYAELSPFVTRLGPLLQANRPIYRARSEATVDGVTVRREALFAHTPATHSALIVFWRDVMD